MTTSSTKGVVLDIDSEHLVLDYEQDKELYNRFAAKRRQLVQDPQVPTTVRRAFEAIFTRSHQMVRIDDKITPPPRDFRPPEGKFVQVVYLDEFRANFTVSKEDLEIAWRCAKEVVNLPPTN